MRIWSTLFAAALLGFVSKNVLRLVVDECIQQTDMKRTAMKEEACSHGSQGTGRNMPHHKGLHGEASGSVRRWKEGNHGPQPFLVSVRKVKPGRINRFRFGLFE